MLPEDGYEANQLNNPGCGRRCQASLRHHRHCRRSPRGWCLPVSRCARSSRARPPREDGGDPAGIDGVTVALVGRLEARHRLSSRRFKPHPILAINGLTFLRGERRTAPLWRTRLGCSRFPVVHRPTAKATIAEIGTAMSRFPSDRHLTSQRTSGPGTIAPPRGTAAARSAGAAIGSLRRSRKQPSAVARTYDVQLDAPLRHGRPRRGHAPGRGPVEHGSRSSPLGPWNRRDG
jgi:hypothetical protein